MVGALAGAVALFVLVTGFRFLSLDFFENDHFTYLTFAHQTALGEWPVRDYDDPGFPGGIAVSALAMLAGGRNLLPEALLTTSMLGLAACLSWWAATRVSGSVLIALGATLLQAIAFPRLYSYPKIAIGAALPLLFLAYARHTTYWSLLGLAALTEVALLLRHDLAVYVGGATLVFLLVTHGRTWLTLHRMAAYVGLCALLTIPYVWYLMWFGLEAHVSSAVGFSQAEYIRTAHWDGLIESGTWLTLVLFLMPVAVGGGIGILRWCRGTWPAHAAVLAGTAVVFLLLDIAMMRDATPARLADVWGPVPVVLAWFVAGAFRWARHQKYRAARIGASATVAVLVAAFAVGVADQAYLGHQLREAGLGDGLRGIEGTAVRQVDLLRDWPWAGMIQGGDIEPVVSYLDRCTLANQSILILGYLPQLPFVARRPFAGGHAWFLPGYFESASDLARIQRRLTERPPAVVVLDPSDRFDLSEHWPIIAERLEEYVPAVALGSVEVRVRRQLSATGTDLQTGLPCFR